MHRSIVPTFPRQFVIIALLPAVLVVMGTCGYMLIERWSLLDSAYMAVITLTTVGFREVRPLTTAGTLFTMALALGGVFTLFYSATSVISSIVRGDLQVFLEGRRVEQKLAQLRGHIIVCGYGRMGRAVCHELVSAGIPFVAIDNRPESMEGFELPGAVALHGDATDDELLRRAHIDTARALVAVVGSDADNLFITMSARLLNDRLFVVSRAADETSETKMLRAGANRVVSPYTIGGFRVAQAVLRPNVVDFVELATRTEHLELNIEEAQITSNSRLAGATVQGSRIRDQLGVIVVAIKKTTGHMIFNPPAETVMEAGDIVIMLGRRSDLDQASRLASASPASV